MTATQLRLQHKILEALKFDYFQGVVDRQNYTPWLLRDIQSKFELSKDDALELLTNLCTRGFAGKIHGNSWEYHIIDGVGISACLEKILLKEADSLDDAQIDQAYEKGYNKKNIILSYITVAIGVVTLFFVFLSYKNDKEKEKLKQRVKILERQIEHQKQQQ